MLRRNECGFAACARIGCRHFHRAAELFRQSGQVQSMHALIICNGTAGSQFAHRHYVDSSVRPAVRIDHRRRRDPDLWRNLAATPVIRRSLAPYQKRYLLQHSAVVGIHRIHAVMFRRDIQNIVHALAWDR